MRKQRNEATPSTAQRSAPSEISMKSRSAPVNWHLNGSICKASSKSATQLYSQSGTIYSRPVSYTHLDVYKRQAVQWHGLTQVLDAACGFIMFDLIDLDSLTKIFNFEKKRDLAKHCKEATIHSSDFASFIFASEAGILPWRHQIFHRDIIPEHLRPTQEEQDALSANGVGPLKGKANKAITKIHQTLSLIHI